MRLLKHWLGFSMLLLATTAFTFTESNINYASTNLCDGVKKIVDAFANKDFKKVQGDLVSDDGGEEQFAPRITISGYKEQSAIENDAEIYFEAILDKKFSSAGKMNSELKAIVQQLEKCLGVKPEYLLTKEYIFYTFTVKGIEVELSGNHPDEERRYINLDITYVKD